jgi:hypothetical protein
MVNLLHNLLIVDYAVGFTGSIHDSRAWGGTRIHQEPGYFLRPLEWVWADSAYTPTTWCVPPFKKPARGELTRLQRHFNYHLSRLRVRSEHTFGLLKGRFQSLKEIRIRINTEGDHTWATIWIVACLILHNLIILIEGDTESADIFEGAEPSAQVEDAEPLLQGAIVSIEEWEEFMSSVGATYLDPVDGESRAGYVFRLNVMKALFSEINL